MKKEFVKVNGMEFTKAGKPILFRGMGIGSWLNMEHFMLGIPTPDNQIRVCKLSFPSQCAAAHTDPVL